MRSIYIAGPMRGHHCYNFPAFYSAAAELQRKGWEVINPAEEDERLGLVDVSRLHDGTIWNVELTEHFDFEVVFERDLALVEEANAIVMLPGWAKSEGALIEQEHAISSGSQVYYGLAEVPDLLAIEPPLVGRNLRPEPGSPIWDSASYTTPDADGNVTFEVRVTDPWTGGQKGRKQAQVGAVDPQALLEVGKVAGFGAEKYDRYNFMRGYAWSLSFDALMRHLLAFWSGEDRDPESGQLHLGHAAWHCLALISFTNRNLGTDDRPPVN